MLKPAGGVVRGCSCGKEDSIASDRERTAQVAAVLPWLFPESTLRELGAQAGCPDLDGSPRHSPHSEPPAGRDLWRSREGAIALQEAQALSPRRHLTAGFPLGEWTPPLPGPEQPPSSPSFDSADADLDKACAKSDLHMYGKRRTFRSGVHSPFERMVCELMGTAPPRGRVEFELDPPERSLVSLRTVDWGDWDNADAASGGQSPADITRKVVQQPAWVDVWGPVRIYTLQRDAGASLLMSKEQKTAVLSVKLMLEAVRRTLPAYAGASIAFWENHDDRYLDWEETPAQPVDMPARTAANPGMPVLKLAELLGMMNLPIFADPSGGLGIELRTLGTVNANGVPTSFSWNTGDDAKGVANTQIWWRNNSDDRGGWHPTSERWDIGTGKSENRLFLSLGSQANRPFLPTNWYFGDRSAFPPHSELTRPRDVGDCPGVSVMYLDGSRSFVTLFHELTHVLLKEAGLLIGTGGSDWCRGTFFGRSLRFSPVRLSSRAQEPNPPGQVWGPHWYCTQLASLFAKYVWGLNWDDPLCWPYTDTLQACASSTCLGPFESHIGVTCGSSAC